MRLPPCVKVLLPSLVLDEVTNSVTMTVDEFRSLINFALEAVTVDEDWYIARYPDIRDAVASRGSKTYASEHYRAHGFLEGRLPHDPVVDEAWYRKSYPDVDEAIRLGHETDAKSHFIDKGYYEGRKPVPDEAAAATAGSGAPAAAPAAPGGARPVGRVPLSRVAVRQWSS